MHCSTVIPIEQRKMRPRPPRMNFEI